MAISNSAIFVILFIIGIFFVPAFIAFLAYKFFTHRLMRENAELIIEIESLKAREKKSRKK